MDLTIKNSGSRTYPYYRIMNGSKEFCATSNFENAELIQRAFSGYKIEMPKRKKQTIESILQKVKMKTGINLKTNLSRKREIVNIRFIYCKISIDMGFTLKETGIPIKREHDRVLYACQKFNDYYQTDPEFRELYNEIKKAL